MLGGGAICDERRIPLVSSVGTRLEGTFPGECFTLRFLMALVETLLEHTNR